MLFMFYFFLAVFVFGLMAVVLLRTSAARLADALRYAVPLLMTFVGVPMLLVGRAGIGVSLLVLAVGTVMRLRRSGPGSRTRPRRSHVRSAALEMELDLDTGEMNGLVLAGRFENQELQALSDADLHVLYDELRSDTESRQLMEAYLDRRMPGWSDDAKAHDSDGLGSPPGAGAMTKEEAYQILGLGSGAGKAEIREAHRRLMKRVHPDTGGSDFLAARINEAKDFLLRRHT